MAVYLLKNNEPHGPYDESVIAEWVRAGNCPPNDLAWRDGMETWQTLGTLNLTPDVGQAGGGGTITPHDLAQFQYSAQPPAQVNKGLLIVGYVLGIIGIIGSVYGGLLTLSGIGIVVGLPLLLICLVMALSGVILVIRAYM